MYVQLQMLQGGNINIMRQVLSIIVDICPLYFFCHIGNNVTQHFEDVENTVYELSWHLLPPKMQQNLPTMIAVAQRDVFIRGIANIRCTRDVFKKVFRNIFKFV